MFRYILDRIPIFLVFILTLGIYFYGLSQGYNNSHNKELNKQKDLMISQQKTIIGQQKQLLLLRESQISNFNTQLNKTKESAEQIERELQNAKNNLDRNNHITRHWMQLYDAEVRANKLYKQTNVTTSGINEVPGIPRASDALEIINRNTNRCNQDIIQLTNLIDYVKNNNEIYQTFCRN